jgi:hypothetical protein
MATTVTVRICVLDDLGVPDMSDLTDEIIDLAYIDALTEVIAIDDVDPQHVAYYPYATLIMRDGRQLVVPLDRETRYPAAQHSIQVLRAGLMEPMKPVRR